MPNQDAKFLHQARRVAEANPRSPVALARLASAEFMAGNSDEAHEAALTVIMPTVGASKAIVAPTSSTLELSAVLVAADVLVAIGHADQAETARSHVAD